ncbi:MAG: hypothetical protein QM778_17810 [Myxococcales bacterium]
MACHNQIGDYACECDFDHVPDSAGHACRMRTWVSSGSAVSGASGEAANPAVAMNGAGEAMVVWQQLDGVRKNIWSSRYTPDEGWGAPQLVEKDDTGDAINPEIVMDADGNATAAWQGFDGTRQRVQAARHTQSKGWSAPNNVQVLTSSSDMINPQLAVAQDGTVHLSWIEHYDTSYALFVNRCSPTGLWGSDERLNYINSSSTVAKIAVNHGGDACLTYTTTESQPTVNLGHRPAGGAWGASPIVQSYSTGLAVLDDAGNATILYNDKGSFRAAGCGWAACPTPSAPVASLPAIEPAMVTNGAGAVFAVWSHPAGTHSDIRARRYTREAGWDAEITIESDDRTASTPAIGVDAVGNGLAIWVQSDNTRDNVWANRFSAKSVSWGQAALIEDQDMGSASEPVVAVNGNGVATAAWIASDGMHPRVWVNRLE